MEAISLHIGDGEVGHRAMRVHEQTERNPSGPHVHRAKAKKGELEAVRAAVGPIEVTGVIPPLDLEVRVRGVIHRKHHRGLGEGKQHMIFPKQAPLGDTKDNARNYKYNYYEYSNKQNL